MPFTPKSKRGYGTDAEFNTKSGGCEEMNTAQVIPFKKPSQPKQEAGKSMYSDKFEQGYVMSSRLYRKEVWPFLSDAARNVYAELENRINGHLKETDYVSYSQLQGGKLENSRKLSSKTVTNGIKELIKLGVITVVASGKQGVKSYRINEVSLIDHFTKESALQSKDVEETTLPSDTNHFTKESETTLPSEHTIDSSIDTLDNNEITREKFSPQNRPMLDFVEYHPADLKSYSLKELSEAYSVQSDFTEQAKVSFPDIASEQILTQLKKLAQWSMSAEKRTSQKWMTTWLNWLSNSKKSPPTKPNTTEKPKKQYHRYGQGVINP